MPRAAACTFGKSSIENGQGEFPAPPALEEVLGSYVAAEAHAGAVKSSKAGVMTKGEVSLALSGVGRGWDLGVAFGKLTFRAEVIHNAHRVARNYSALRLVCFCRVRYRAVCGAIQSRGIRCSSRAYSSNSAGALEMSAW